MPRKDLLFLVHRIPYPPNKGDKIRSFNILKHLVKSYRVHVGAFVDDPNDWQYADDLKAICGDVFLVDINPRIQKIKSLKGLLTKDPLTLPYYSSKSMQTWVDNKLAGGSIDRILVFSSPMAQFVAGPSYSHLRRIADFVDIDSDKWAQYSDSKPWPLSWIYGRESRTLFAFERRVAREFDATVFVSADERDMFKKMVPEAGVRIVAVHNGVDTEYCSPEHEYSSPYPDQAPRLIFTGAMDYWANADAVQWFARDIFPSIRAEIPSAEFYIVGSRPSPDVLNLGKLSGITVTGAVHDIRPYIFYARASVAPMRIARGIQNKVLEAMSMGKPVLATQEAAEGITAKEGVELLIGTDAGELSKQAIKLLREDHKAIGVAARKCVLKHYGWQQNLRYFNDLLEGSVHDPNSFGGLPQAVS